MAGKRPHPLQDVGDEDDDEEREELECLFSGWEADEVIPGLFLGGFSSVMDVPRILSLNVTRAVSLLENPQDQANITSYWLDKQPDFDLRRLQLVVDDESSADILSLMEGAVTFIHKEMQQKKNILVHCAAGVSRSTTIVVAYLVRFREMSLKDAFEHVQGKRRGVMPNRGFWRQLRAWEVAERKTASYTLDELPGSIMFEQEAIERIVSRFEARRKRDAEPGAGGAKCEAEPPRDSKRPRSQV